MPDHRPGPLLLPLALLLLSGAVASREAPPPDEVAARLEATTVTFQFLETPAGRALTRLGELAGVPVIVEDETDLAAPVTFRGEDMPARRAFRWVCHLADLGTTVQGGALRVAAAQVIRARRCTLRLFDIRELVLTSADFPGPDLDLEPVVDTGYFSGLDRSEPLTPEFLMELIQTTIDPRSWEEDPDSCFISAEPGMLVVSHTPEVHARIGTLLRDLRARFTRLVELAGYLLRVPTPVWSAHLGGDEPRVLLEPDACAALLAADVEVLGVARTTCRSTQRVSPSLLVEETYLADLDVEVAQQSAIVDPILAVLLEGLVLDLRPVVSADGTSVNLRMDLSSGQQGGPKRKLAYGSGDAGAGGQGPVSIELPALDLVRVRCSARLPAGGGCAFSCTSPMAGDPASELLVLLVQATPVEPEEGK